MKNTISFILTTSLAGLMLSCGQADDPKTKDNQAESGNASLEAEELADATVEELVEESTELVAELEEVTGLDNEGISLTEPIYGFKARGITFERNCQQLEDGSAQVEITRSRGASRWFHPAGVGALGQRVGARESITRNWSKVGEAIECSENEKYAMIDKTNMDGIRLKIEFKRGKAGQGLYKSAFSRLQVHSGGFLAEGSRTIDFAQETTEENLFVTTATISSSVVKSIAHKKWSEADYKTSQVTINTLADAPIVIKSERDTETYKLISRTIVSGQKESTGKNGGVLLTTYENVKFVPNDGCQRPQAGKISTTVTLPSGEQKAYSVEFKTESALLTKANGDIVELGLDCEIEQ